MNERIFRNYLDRRWLYEVVTERANIELMFNDPYWARLDLRTDYPFGVLVFNVTQLVRGFHPSEFTNPLDDPYRFATGKKWEIASLDDYVMVLDRLFREAKAAKARRAAEREAEAAEERAERDERLVRRPVAQKKERGRSENLDAFG